MERTRFRAKMQKMPNETMWPMLFAELSTSLYIQAMEANRRRITALSEFDKRRCYTCDNVKDCTSFAPGSGNWKITTLTLSAPSENMDKKQEACGSCRTQKPKHEFTIAVTKYGDPCTKPKRKICDACHKTRAAHECTQALASASQVQKLPRR